MKRSIFSAAIVLATASPGWGANAVEPLSTPTNFLELLGKGGITMIPLGLLSFVTVVLVLMFFMIIRRNAIVSDRFMRNAEVMLEKRDYAGLISLSQRRNECIARITQCTLDFMESHPGVPFENLREIAQTEGSRQSGILTSRITYLADIGAIAPMVGLLGTVLGMIKAFIEIASGARQGVREMGLAEGVSEALIATAFGLAISIFAFVFYSFFRARLQKLVSELESAATHWIALLHHQYISENAGSSRTARGGVKTTAARKESRDLQGI